MIKAFASSLFAATLLCAAPASAAEPNSTYFHFDAGGFNMADTNLNGLIDMSYSTGYGFNFAYGEEIAPNLLGELNVGYYQADGEGQYGPITLGTSTRLLPVMGNVRLMIPLAGKISLDLGGGLGGIRSSTDAAASYRNLRASGGSETWDFGAQGMANLNFGLSAHTDLTLGYRMMFSKNDVEDIRASYFSAGIQLRF